MVEIARNTISRGMLDELFGEGRALIIASNRGPVTFDDAAEGESAGYRRNSGGLVTALTGLIRHIDATWIACAKTEADARWGQGFISLGDEGEQLNAIFLSPDPEAYEGYYNVIANPLLWFLQHSMWDVPRNPVIDQATWRAWEDGYKRVNQTFADAIVGQVRSSRKKSLVMLQDYHLYLAARYIRDRLQPRERPTLLHFTHIPWPGPEYWRILPPAMRQAILDGMCAANVLGFQTREDALNFLRTCESYLPRAHVDSRRSRIWYRNQTTHVRDFPISIDVASLQQLVADPAAQEYGAEIEDMAAGRQLILRVDRIEPSKNIVRGFQAYEELLDLYPQHRDRVFFLALLVPSRTDVPEYDEYQEALMGAAGRLNARFGTQDWEPARVLMGENYPRAVAALQRYDVLLVNPIADGMNLVAKEGPVVNRQDGVLVLSEGAGASQQLQSGAIIISPCDVYATAEALHQGLTMPPAERQERAARLRWMIEREDITSWMADQLRTVMELRV